VLLCIFFACFLAFCSLYPCSRNGPREVAQAGDRIFMVTDNAHLLALNRFTGQVEWETVMADWHQNYNATSAPGEPGSQTWKDKAIERPSAVAWFTGTYDPELDTLYWPTGNPGPDFNDDERGGDNLYSCSVIALDPKTGKMKWYYQFTPHDFFDWDLRKHESAGDFFDVDILGHKGVECRIQSNNLFRWMGFP